MPTSTAEVDRGHDGPRPFRGGKYQMHEGGTRVPLIVRWPGRVVPGTVSDALVGQVDLLASFAAPLGVELGPTDAIDSRDTLAAFLGDDPVGAPFLVEEAGVRAIRQGAWKRIRRQDRLELHELARDVGEQIDLVGSDPDRAQALAALLERVEGAPGGARAVAAQAGPR